MEVSIIIRVKNERESLEKALAKLKEQTFQDFELIIVDNSSTDDSEKVVFDYFPKSRIKVADVPLAKFNYPYASNLGASKALGKYLVYLSAHSYPLTNTWLEDGLIHFKDEKVAGVFAYPITPPDTTLAEKIIWGTFNNIFNTKLTIHRKYRLGILGTTNAIIRRDLWEKRQFNIDYAKRGEDGEWAKYWMKKGYVIVHDPKFRIYHSHRLSFIGIIK